jgi:Spy/CpxP family protein refolding chaperone
MCHASGRASRRHTSVFAFQFPEWAERHEHHEHSAQYDHDEWRGCFMPRHGYEHHDHDRSDGRSGFGVRRPLRFLAHKLDLDEKQVAELARILGDLKTERAQAEVDERRSLAEFADALAGDAFDESKAGSAGERRVQSAAKVREALVTALRQIHAILNADQRQRLAYMIRTGVLAI